MLNNQVPKSTFISYMHISMIEKPTEKQMTHMLLYLSISVCESIYARLRKFTWSSSILNPKGYGGLGIRRLEDFNRALPAKIGWSLATNQDKAWVQLLNAKYLKGKSFLKSTMCKKSSCL